MQHQHTRRARGWRLFFGLGLALAGLCNSWAQGYGEVSAHLKITRAYNEVLVNPDLSAQMTTLIEMQAMTDTGAIGIGKLPIHINPDLEAVEILQGHTEKADGRKIPIQPEHVQRQTGVLAAGTGISWPGAEVHQIIFPDVQKGDKTFVQYRKQIRKTALPDWLALSGTVAPLFDWDDFQLKLVAPAHLNLQVQAKHMGLQQEQIGEQRIWHIQSKIKSRASEIQSANALLGQPHWMVSSFTSLEQLGDVYARATREKLRLTPDVQQLADQITQGLSQPEDKARAIHKWVVQNIRYVAIFLGTGGFVPHELPEILRNRYGDCKDHVLLMMGLLQAAGIESAPALINTAEHYELPPLAVAQFNHVLVYIPSLQQFVDPTFATIPYGKLSWKDSAKPVVVGLTQGAQILYTPAFAASDNVVRVQSVWTVDARGDAHLDMQAHTQGEAATTMQDQLEQIPAGMSGAAVQRILKKANLNGNGFMQYPKVQREAQTQSFSAQIDIQNYVKNPEAASLNPHPMLSGLPIYVGNNLGPHADSERRSDVLCVPIRIEENFELRLPPEVQILFVPKGITQEGPGIAYSSHYEVSGQVIKGQRRFSREVTAKGHICSPEDYAQRKPALDAINKDLRSAVLFKAL